MIDSDSFRVYGGTSNHELDEDTMDAVNAAAGLNLKFSHVWHDHHPDSEPAFIIEHYDEIKDRHIIIFGCPTTDKYELQLRDLVTACKHQYGAASITLVLSYIRYRRQDRSKKDHEITRLRWFIKHIKDWGADRLVACEPHSIEHTQQFCNEFELPLFLADPTRIYADALRTLSMTVGPENLVVYTPDWGAIGRGLRLAEALNCTLLATPKSRVHDEIKKLNTEGYHDEVVKHFNPRVHVSCSIGDAEGKHVIMREDEVATGGTSAKTGIELKQIAKAVCLAATHPVCSPGWKGKLLPHPEDKREPFDKIWLGNTRPRGDGSKYEHSTGGRITQLNMAPCIASALLKALESI